ncbi:hypothetical protein CJI53_06840 [Bifidobacteriaceae bacterium VN002]|nr:hypothetical protein CJI53_06840 [Bifidobacteriaceae bacterium VN002]
MLVEKYIKPSGYLEFLRIFHRRDSRFFLLSRRVTTFGAEAHLIRCEKSRISTLFDATHAPCSVFVLKNAGIQYKRTTVFVLRHARKAFLKKSWENSSKTLKCVFLRFKCCLSTNFTAMRPLLWISLRITSFFSV